MKTFDTTKLSRILPLLEKDRVKGAPATIDIVYGVPSAAKVLGVGYPPLTVTVALGAELDKVTVIFCDTVFTEKVVEAELELASLMITVWAPAIVEVGTVKVPPLNVPLEVVVVAPLIVTACAA